MIKKFIRSLESPPANNVFNPWWERDKENDADKNAPEIRKRQLEAYLDERAGRTEYLLVAEALGYQGGHFTGIPMTSERILLGHSAEVEPGQVIRIRPARTSKEGLKAMGFCEPTATIVWGHIISQGINTRDVLLWNAFPWHPYEGAKKYLSNRTPSDGEMAGGRKILANLIELFKPGRIFALGKKAEAQLKRLNISAVPIRHPAFGGAGQFRSQIDTFLRPGRISRSKESGEDAVKEGR